MKRNFRLTKQKDFDRVRSEGQTKKDQYIVLLYNRNELEYPRAAVVASKKVGNAVTRNHVKRLMRASLDDIWRELAPGWDLILYARYTGADASYREIFSSVNNLLLKANLIVK